MRTTRTLFAALIAALTLTGTAFANEVISNDSLADILVEKGVITKEEATKAGKSKDGKLQLEALFFLNTYHQQADTTTAAGTTNVKTTGLAVDRAYFTGKYFFNDDWMMRITLDAGNDANTAKRQNVFLKAAYVEGKLVGKAAVLRLGQSHTPWIDYEQGLWKHRYVAQVMSDRYSFDDSFDLGVGLKGELANGLLQYFVTETNGTGYSTANRSGSVDLNTRIGIYPIDGLTLDFQFRDGHRGTKTSGTAPTAGVKSQLIQSMVSYGTNDFRLGGNYIDNKDKAKSATQSILHDGFVTSALRTAAVGDELKSTAFAVWGWVKFPGTDFGAFGRFENIKHKLNTNATEEKLNRYMGGLEYTALKGVDFSLVVDNTKLKNRGGVAADQRKDIRYGLFSQVKF